MASSGNVRQPLRIDTPSYPDVANRDLPTGGSRQTLIEALQKYTDECIPDNLMVQNNLSEDDRLQPVLHRPQNTCYRNAALAALFNIAPFVNFLHRMDSHSTPRLIVFTLLRELHDSFRKGGIGSTKPYRQRVDEFWRQINDDSEQSWQQFCASRGETSDTDAEEVAAEDYTESISMHDSAEFVSWLFRRLEEVELQVPVMDDIANTNLQLVFQRLFVFRFAARVAFNCCSETIGTKQRVHDTGLLAGTMIDVNFSDEQTSLGDALSSIFYDNILKERKCPNCEKVQRYPTFTKFLYLPEVIFIGTNYASLTGIDPDIRFKIPEFLDLSDLRDDPGSNDLKPEIGKADCIYRLEATISYTAEDINTGGHYIAYVRRGVDKWDFVSDFPVTVSRATMQEMQDDEFFRPRCLIYVRNRDIDIEDLPLSNMETVGGPNDDSVIESADAGNNPIEHTTTEYFTDSQSTTSTQDSLFAQSTPTPQDTLTTQYFPIETFPNQDNSTGNKQNQHSGAGRIQQALKQQNLDEDEAERDEADQVKLDQDEADQDELDQDEVDQDEVEQDEVDQDKVDQDEADQEEVGQDEEEVNAETQEQGWQGQIQLPKSEGHTMKQQKQADSNIQTNQSNDSSHARTQPFGRRSLNSEAVNQQLYEMEAIEEKYRQIEERRQKSHQMFIQNRDTREKFDHAVERANKGKQNVNEKRGWDRVQKETRQKLGGWDKANKVSSPQQPERATTLVSGTCDDGPVTTGLPAPTAHENKRKPAKAPWSIDTNPADPRIPESKRWDVARFKAEFAGEGISQPRGNNPGLAHWRKIWDQHFNQKEPVYNIYKLERLKQAAEDHDVSITHKGRRRPVKKDYVNALKRADQARLWEYKLYGGPAPDSDESEDGLDGDTQVLPPPAGGNNRRHDTDEEEDQNVDDAQSLPPQSLTLPTSSRKRRYDAYEDENQDDDAQPLPPPAISRKRGYDTNEEDNQDDDQSDNGYEGPPPSPASEDSQQQHLAAKTTQSRPAQRSKNSKAKRSPRQRVENARAVTRSMSRNTSVTSHPTGDTTEKLTAGGQKSKKKRKVSRQG